MIIVAARVVSVIKAPPFAVHKTKVSQAKLRRLQHCAACRVIIPSHVVDSKNGPASRRCIVSSEQNARENPGESVNFCDGFVRSRVRSSAAGASTSRPGARNINSNLRVRRWLGETKAPGKERARVEVMA